MEKALSGLRAAMTARKSAWSTLLWAVAIQLVLLTLTVLVVVVTPSRQKEPVFVASKTVYLPQRELEHRAALAAFQRASSAPLRPERIATQLLLPETFPELPALPAETFSPFESDMPRADSLGLLETSGLLSSLDGLSVGSSEISFFGIREEATRFVILVDTSNSMFERTRSGHTYRFDFKVIKEEAKSLIESLNANTLFNVAVYEGGSMAWEAELLPATTNNKAMASTWLDSLGESPSMSIARRSGDGPKLIEGGGTRLDTGLRQVFSFQPEVIFIVTDGEINRSPGGRITEEEILDIIDDLQSGLESDARIHVIQYETAVAREAELSTMRAIASRNQGRYRKIQAVEF